MVNWKFYFLAACLVFATATSDEDKDYCKTCKNVFESGSESFKPFWASILDSCKYISCGDVHGETKKPKAQNTSPEANFREYCRKKCGVVNEDGKLKRYFVNT